jgi:fluoroacetyl-CoA thioesterase
MEPGATFRFRYTVTDADTAAALKPITGDDFPAVFATTRCIALLELAAGRLLKQECAPGQLSVRHERAVIDEARLLEGAEKRRR